MSSAEPPPSESAASMDALVTDAAAKLESLETALHGLNQIRARFSTDDGLVTAEVDGNGALTGLWLAEGITQRPAREVGPLITWASQEAARRASDQRSAVLARLNAGFGAPVAGQAQDASTATD